MFICKCACVFHDSLDNMISAAPLVKVVHLLTSDNLTNTLFAHLTMYMRISLTAVFTFVKDTVGWVVFT